jgi:hypothetical protein
VYTNIYIIEDWFCCILGIIMESGPSIRPLRQAEANYSGTGTQRHKITISLLHLHYPFHGAIYIDEQHHDIS